MTKHLATTAILLASLGWACSGSSGDSSSATPAPGPATERLVEEGDIVWLDDPILYVLGKTHGLSIVGLGNPAAPLLIGRVPLAGDPVELYLHNGSILAITKNILSSTGTVTNSLLSVVDVKQPDRPSLLSTLVIDGQATNSRLVGDILYTASDSGGVIESVDVTNPRAVRVVDRLNLPLGQYGAHVLVTPTVFYVATVSWGGTAVGECASSGYDKDGCTTVMAVDISSPAGLLRRGASYAMVGMVNDRWSLDLYEGVLRVLVSRGGWWSSTGRATAAVRTFMARSADEIDPLGWLSLSTDHPDQVKAVRFDGMRGYVVTFLQTDPLFTIDLSNPASPRVGGALQTSGWLDFIIPHGDHLLGIGRDQDSPGGVWRLQASLYDVSTLSAPKLLSRQPFGDNYTALPDQADNLAKVVRVIDELSILLVPYNSTSVGYSSTGASDGQLAVFFFGSGELTALGTVTSADPILRALSLPPEQVVAVTEATVGVIQISAPLAIVGTLDLGQPVAPPTSPSTVDGGSMDGGSMDGGSHD